MLRPQFHVATWLSCFQLYSMSRPQKHVATSFMLSSTDPWSQLPFLCYDLNCLSVHYLVATWTLGRDLIVSFLAEIYVATLKACHDINSAHPISTSLLSHNILLCNSFLLSRHEFQVATLIGVSNLYLCRNLKLPGRDIASPFSITFWSRHHCSIATNNIFFSCRDLKMVSRHYLP